MTEITVPLYKVLVGGKSCHGGALDWSLPTPNDDGSWTPGEWMALPDPERPLVLCQYALHLTDQPAAWYLPDAQCWLAEFRGESVGELTGAWESKLGVREARIVRSVDWSDVNVWAIGGHTIRAGVGVASGNASVTASGSASVTAYGSASVRAYDNASVRAYDNASVTASGSASVRASGSASVRAYGSASVRAYDNASVRAYDNASVRASGSASVRASGSASVRAYDNASVRAYDNASVTASGSASVTAYDNASVTAYDNASVRAYVSATVISTPWHSTSAQIALSDLAAHIDRRGGKVVCRVAGEASDATP